MRLAGLSGSQCWLSYQHMYVLVGSDTEDNVSHGDDDDNTAADNDGPPSLESEDHCHAFFFHSSNSDDQDFVENYLQVIENRCGCLYLSNHSLYSPPLSLSISSLSPLYLLFPPLFSPPLPIQSLPTSFFFSSLPPSIFLLSFSFLSPLSSPLLPPSPLLSSPLPSPPLLSSPLSCLFNHSLHLLLCPTHPLLYAIYFGSLPDLLSASLACVNGNIVPAVLF